MKTRVTLLGPPASGKGTQADLLSRRLGYSILSTGSLLRAEIEKQTDLGRQAAELINAGNLVPDEIVVAMVTGRLTGDKFLFDGFPRTVAQAEALDLVLEERGMPLDIAIHLEVTEETIRHRILNRVICDNCHFVGTRGGNVAQDATACPRCQEPLKRRADDTDEVITHRLEEYREKTAPLVPYYQQTDRLVTITGRESREEVYERICQVLEIEPQFNEASTTPS